MELHRGNVAEALALASDAVALSEEGEQVGLLAHALGVLAEVEAQLGREESCREHASAALKLAHGIHADLTAVYPLVALGVLELGLGHVDAAAEQLGRADVVLDRLELVDPGFLLARPLLVESLVRQGEHEEGERLLAGYEERAARYGRPLGTALAQRCRGLLAADDAYEDAFARSLRAHPALDRPFERARTQLALGSRRRRANRRGAAREPLTEALHVFEQLGASTWAAETRRELSLAGAGDAQVDDATFDALEKLTPQELRVALLVAKGLSNREIAAALFVSARTVEAHLRNVFPKVGVRSRTELARAVANRG
jgi:ATP/maltotriose-dependent transcriptional regulator MalT